jgi:HK97 family phage prohead protease
MTLMTRRRKATGRTLDLAVRFDAGDDAGAFTGYASVFGEPDSFGDTIKPGAFRKSLREHVARKTKPGLFWMHDPREVIGVWTDLAEDERGLKVAGQLVLETARGSESHALLKAGALNGLSIGFRARSAERGPNGGRILTDIDLVEISLVSLPAASKARVTNVKTLGAAGLPSAVAFVKACRNAARSLNQKAKS